MESSNNESSTIVMELLGTETPPKPVNKQLYENSTLAGSDVEKEYLANKNALYGRKLPNLAINNEKPEHRLILLLKLKGFSNREIAHQADYTESHVSQICRQPWFQQRLVELLSERVEEPLVELVRIEAANSMHTLIELRDTSHSHEVRKGCAMAILDRHLGKPIQRQEINQSVVHSVARIEDLDKELAELDRQEKELLLESGITSGPAADNPTPERASGHPEELRTAPLPTAPQTGEVPPSGSVQASVCQSREPLREVNDGLRGGLLVANGREAVLQA